MDSGLTSPPPRAELAHPPFLLGGSVRGQEESMAQTLPVLRLWREGRQEHRRNSALPIPTRGKMPCSPPAASLLSEGGRASAPWKGAFWQLPAPLPPPCPKAPCRREPYGPLWNTLSRVQSLPGEMQARLPSQLASPPSRCLLPRSRPERGRLWGPGSPSQDEQGSLLGSTTHTLRENC